MALGPVRPLSRRDQRTGCPVGRWTSQTGNISPKLAGILAEQSGDAIVVGTGINVSATVDALLSQEVERLYWERWNAQNKEAIDHYNARIAREGLPLAKHVRYSENGVVLKFPDGTWDTIPISNPPDDAVKPPKLTPRPAPEKAPEQDVQPSKPEDEIGRASCRERVSSPV